MIAKFFSIFNYRGSKPRTFYHPPSYLTLDKQNVDYVCVSMNTDSVFEIKKPINPLLLNITGKVTTTLIFILTKLFANLTLYMN